MSFNKEQLIKIRQKVHPNCIICSPNNPKGLKLDFTLANNGSISNTFIFNKEYEGHDGILHGGIISAILDGSMGNCLFAHGHITFTADFHLRFKHMVFIDNPLTVRAWITKIRPPLYKTKAEIYQDNIIKVIATAKFMKK
jgi:acyl-coenzyme A thioesterase PaaI-like protein